ncbi:MAG: sugar nucleotide-binding protein [Planctomycetes bacterium]|nr:sugar nucleotide-binding protein [Planctomycetota bacterium]
MTLPDPTPARPVERPELWAGIECTVNRVRDRYSDQLRKNGHHDRISDLDLFADLGVRAMRYPVLWERVAPDGLDRADWTWSDRRLARLRELGIRPIVGLLHHGSGPRSTSLIDPDFPVKFAAYARACAERYPWVHDWTPVNEPLTTARFSGLYGVWYPHGTDDATFFAALFNQIRGTVLAMREIRTVIPQARLVQTEDLGKTWSTPRLAYQAAFENERRWFSLDLLAGRIGEGHALASYLQVNGLTYSDLAWFRENPCHPQIIGVNHYLTSERYLDERLDRFPADTHGGNGRHTYADVEAVRASAIGGPKQLLREAWERYSTPIAVTETHLHCTREEQLRWFLEVWRAACDLRAEGIPLQAVTAWAGLGSYDWVSLLTRDEGAYEPGLFDLRGGRPRKTAVANLVAALGQGQEPRHPVLAAPGWWRRDIRILYDVDQPLEHTPLPTQVAPLLITGQTGTLGRAIAQLCRLRGIAHVVTNRSQLDIADQESLDAALDRHRPWAVVNTAGYVRVADAETDTERCWRENVIGPQALATATASRGIPLVSFSSDLVFDGAKGTCYAEGDRPRPLNVYGRSKAEAEIAILAANPGALIVRTAAFFSPWDDYNFITVGLRSLIDERSWEVYDSMVVSPTYVPELVNAVLDLLIDGEHGIWHIANDGETSWLDFARIAAEVAGLDTRLIRPIPPPDYLPRFSALTSERGVLLPTLDRSLRSYHAEIGPRLRSRSESPSIGRMTAQSARRHLGLPSRPQERPIGGDRASGS